MNPILDAAASVDPRITLGVMLGLIDSWAIGEVWLSRAQPRDKLLWTGIVLVCPIVGCLFWFVLGPKARRSTRGRKPSDEEA